MLGLDRLASEKRAAAANEAVDGRRKRQRVDDGAEPYFKGEYNNDLSILPLMQ